MTGQQLKNSILQLAIEGKLVPQDPNDEPASVLLERIKAERVSKNPSDKRHYENIIENTPFEIPKSWEWVKIKNIFTMQAGKTIKAQELTNQFDESHKYPCFGGNGLRGYIAKRSHTGTHCIIGRQGALCGNVKIASGDFYATEHAVVVDSWANIDVYWSYYFLTALNLNQYSTATAQPGLAVSNIVETIIPLPPLNEQKRIVAKIEELLPLVDEYSKAQEALDKLNAKLPDDLRKSILQQAIEGKLVPQDPNDEPASELLKRINPKLSTPCDNPHYENTPFEIPKSWVWVRFSDIADRYIGKTPERGNDRYWNEHKYHWVSISDMSNYGIINETKEYISEEASKIMRNISPKGSLIMSFKLTVGRTSILNIDAFHNEAIITIIPYVDSENALRNYLFTFLPLITQYGNSVDAIKGITLNSTSIANLLIPLPPLNEQKRIVAKIEQLFSRLDTITTLLK